VSNVDNSLGMVDKLLDMVDRSRLTVDKVAKPVDKSISENKLKEPGHPSPWFLAILMGKDDFVVFYIDVKVHFFFDVKYVSAISL
jgi:hypothetical protein